VARMRPLLLRRSPRDRTSGRLSSSPARPQQVIGDGDGASVQRGAGAGALCPRGARTPSRSCLSRAQFFPQRARCPLRLVRVGDRSEHDGARRAGRERLVEIAQVQASDREERHLRVQSGVADQLDADRRPIGLRRRLVYRSDADVVHERLAARGHRLGGVDLGRRVRREPDQHVASHELAHLRGLQVVLTNVYPIGADLARDERAVVDDQQRADPLAQRARGVRDGGELVVAELLVTQLHDVDAAGDGRANHLGEVAPAGFGVAHEIQARRRETRTPVAAEVGRAHRVSLAGRTRAVSRSQSRASINAMAHSPDVLVIGGGVIGLSIAWRARERGLRVTVLERDTLGSGTSRVAAGMLAPVAEVEFGEAGRRQLELGLRSAAEWPDFARELHAASGADVELLRTGTLMLARDDDEARELQRQISLRDSLGLASVRLRASDARAREPALAPTLRLALEAPDDHSVDPRLVLDALRAACAAAGVQLREHAPVARVAGDADGRVRGARLFAAGGDGELVTAERVVVACGAWSARLGDGRERVPVRPVRGQLLRLRDPRGPGLLTRVVRFDGGYLVPRADGAYVLGATVEERGFDVQPDARGVYELLRDAHELVPDVGELKLEELCVGLRPGTPDNAPAIGLGARDGLVWATGHYRNGILLAPLTARLVADLLSGEQADGELLATCAPARFARASSPARAPLAGVIDGARA
jgi:glycine oxidase